MKWLGSIVAGAFLEIIGTLIGKALTALGIGVATYTGFSATLTWLKTSAVTSLMALPPDVVSMLSLMRVGSCISMVSSALIVRLTFQGMQSDTVKRWIKK